MDSIGIGRSPYDIGDNDLKELWGQESFDSHFEEMALDNDADWTNILDNQPIILNDRMMTDAVQSPHIQSEHSYSLTLNDEMPQSPFSIHNNIKLEDYGKDMETECFPTVSMTTATGQSDFVEDVLIKQEPASPPPLPPSPKPSLSSMKSSSSVMSASPLSMTSISPSPSPPALPSPSLSSSSMSSSSPPLHPQSLLKQPTIVLATRPTSSPSSSQRTQEHLVFPKLNIKLEPQISTTGFSLPPTPPSSNGSDSDGSLSPVHGTTHPSSPPALLGGSNTVNRRGHSHTKVVVSVTAATNSNSSSSSSNSSSGRNSSNSTSLISSQPKGATGVLILTDEEKRTLLAEGYPIPQRLPLTKAEERSLKKIRRKIKNKISAQESRRKKKEYMDALEKKVEVLTNENIDFKKKLETLEGSNKSLLSQLQALLREFPSKQARSIGTQTFPISSNNLESSVHSVEMTDIGESKGR